MALNDESSFQFRSDATRAENLDDLSVTIEAHGMNKSELLSALSRLLRFPDYFDENWDALEECLRDFYWVREKRILITHTALPNLSASDQKVYLQVLLSAVGKWQSSKEHSLVVVFPPSFRSEIESILEV